MNTRLAIVIPYFKPTYFLKSLESIRRQSDQRYKVYVGDDCSPFNIESILQTFHDQEWLNEKVTYKRFENNLGGDLLVGQWTRCIAMTGEEEWIWLFSDDDEMEPGCVADFYHSLEETKEFFSLYKFESIVIDQEGKLLKKAGHTGIKVLDPFDLILDKIEGRTHTFAVEYIFSRSIYVSTGGFVEFPLAWGSDDATWVKFSDIKGIAIVPGSHISWRLSNQNITGNITGNGLMKARALLKYGRWIIHHFSNHPEIRKLRFAMKVFIIQQIQGYLPYLTPATLMAISYNGLKIWGFDLRLIASLAFHTNKNLLKRSFQNNSK